VAVVTEIKMEDGRSFSGIFVSPSEPRWASPPTSSRHCHVTDKHAHGRPYWEKSSACQRHLNNV
jgi:hypothetical protein